MRISKHRHIFALILSAGFLFELHSSAQGTAFTYQGHLQQDANAANGTYDFKLSIWDSQAGVVQIGNAVTNIATAVKSGVFSVIVDFGNGFDGNARWLEIGVRTNGAGSFTTLSPRQALTPTPYAIFAGGANASGLTGTISPARIADGTITSNMLAAGVASANLAASGQSSVPSGGMLLSTDPSSSNLISAGYTRIGGRLDLAWQNRTALSAPSVRSDHTAVWSGNKMMVWGGFAGSGPLNPYLNTGGSYDPAADFWSTITTSNAPPGRSFHTAVWTGNSMIVWGGNGQGTLLNDGGVYNPSLNSWTAVELSNAPSARVGHTAVWDGSEMIIWGGRGGGGDTWLNTGAKYNPAAGIWIAINTNGAPAPRSQHAAVWTGNEMIVWGGLIVIGNVFTYYQDGARYNPSTDSWSPMSTNNAPSGRNGQTAIWTGTEMIVWGGGNPNLLNSGGRYNPVSDTWTSITTNGAPIPRSSHTAVWSSKEMIIWGGGILGGFSNTGGQYNPVTDAWSDVTTSGAPSGRDEHTAIWTGNEMIIFGGVGGDGNTVFADPYSYTPSRVMYLYVKP